MYNYFCLLPKFWGSLGYLEANTVIQGGHCNSKEMSSGTFGMTAFKNYSRVVLNDKVEGNLANLKG